MKREEAIEKGLVFYCLKCRCVYKKIPQQQYEDGYDGSLIGICRRCGCDLFARLDNEGDQR